MPDFRAPTVSRREFLQVSATSSGLALASSSATTAASAPAREMSCVFLLLTGGPSHLETWDPKPDAPAEVRGPFGSITTSVPGIRIGEHLPRLAEQAQRWALIRSVHHTAPPIHETGQQLLQTGRLSRPDREQPHFGAVLSQRFGPRRPGVPPFVILPALLGNTGVSVSHGQSAGFLGMAHEPVVIASVTLPTPDRDRYGRTAFGDHCLHACRLVETGVRCVVVNMFDALYDQVTWDCHADRRCLRSTLDDYRRTLCPTLDRACAALIDDLQVRGLLESTLVVAAGEFGRTPRVNSAGGRDHWARVWSILFAGGGVRGGRVIGASDKYATEPASRPVRAEDVAATVYRVLGIDPEMRLTTPQGEKITLTDGCPVSELFS